MPRTPATHAHRFPANPGSGRLVGPKRSKPAPTASRPREPLLEVHAEPDGSVASDPRQDWLLWQLADSAFPTGGFAHSGGLEAAFQQGELRTLAELRAFLEASLGQLGHAALPFVTSAHRDPAAWREIDSWCDRFTTNHVANRASRLQGQAMLASAERVFPALDLRKLRESDPDRLACYHFAPIFGLILRALGFRCLPAGRLFFFLHLRGLVAAAVRLGLVGPLQGQALQHDLAPHAERIVLRCHGLGLEDVAQTAPLVDLWQANQDRLYSRLFQS